jgi:hypothetical protein
MLQYMGMEGPEMRIGVRSAMGAEVSPPLLLVEGELVGLGPLRRDLVPTYLRWISAREVARGTGSTAVQTLEAEHGWFERSSNDPAAAHFTVYDLADLAPVGTTALAAINHHQSTAIFGIMLGDRRGRGLGRRRLASPSTGRCSPPAPPRSRRSADGAAPAFRCRPRPGLRGTGRRR